MAKSKLMLKEEMVLALNLKKYKDLNSNLKKFIKALFPNVKNDELVFCKKNNGSKIDLIVSLGSVSKNIALFKEGICCVYRDKVKNLISFLLSIGVSNKCVLALLSYHYADGSYGGDGNSKYFGDLLQINYIEQIQIVNEEFLNIDLYLRLLDYILFMEKSGKGVDYFYIGDSRRSIYATKNEVKSNILLKKDNYRHKYMRLGIFNFMPLKRATYYSEEIEVQKHYCLLRVRISNYVKKSQEKHSLDSI